MKENITKEDFQKAVEALEKANTPRPYLAIVDPKWTEEDIEKILGNIK